MNNEKQRSLLKEAGLLFCREPYRLFFPYAIVLGMIGVSHWLLYALGWISNYSGFFHSSIQMLGYMSCFIFGFLLTAMPRFIDAPRCSPQELAAFFLLMTVIWVSLCTHHPVLAETSFILFLICFLRFIVKRIRIKQTEKHHDHPVRPPTEFVWIPVAVLHGLFGATLLIAGQLGWVSPRLLLVARLMLEQGFLLCIVIGVGGFLGPRLMGWFRLLDPKQVQAVSQALAVRKRRITIHLFGGILIFLSFWLEGFERHLAAYLIRAAVVTLEFFWTGALPKWPRVPDFYAKLLWVSFWMVILGHWLLVFLPHMRLIGLHVVFIGGYSLMTFSVATMVVLSHAGEAAQLKKPLLVLWVVAVFITAALATRITAIFNAEHYFQFLAIAAGFWLVGGLGWLLFIIPKVLKMPAGIDFEKMHEEAKRRVCE
ncbi:MAG: hypothetical protein COV74_10705 [Candidatus Omnitrophica bacterium CG11_big_fil_rev_8_21_14_0_20_45_26]|uniref:NnrS family protein n=1 Tax=Candidatus Abzuiibacterium crystallinum TaxID=1974748 RepID=A0A2H0LKV9_9BACT|nr:MAG: hypothetical protein COV74_10705 [Candidatus Omnitrophica bacterium CG11_big_fil_rev_8_21_14_0_20_45_26]PIW63865.1 MAG: hypothetical protein COW12_08105 [Candidatus Omnitrophica bacterium CG12_big_fil_rev_8_21_14_0_65_45_16]